MVAAARTKPTWLVKVRGSPPHGHEVAVIRSDNRHGFDSWGWPSDVKIIISSSGAFSEFPIPEYVWKRLLEFAAQIAAELNSMGDQ